LLNFGALIAFMGVNAAALTRYYLRAKEKHWTDLVSPVLGFLVCFFIWLNLSPAAQIAGGIWMVIGIAYGAVKTKGFQSDLVKFDVPADNE